MTSHAATGAIDHHHDHTTSTGIPNKKLLMWAFLASDCMFFGTLISTHLIYRLHPPPGNPIPRQIFDVPLTSFSTFILLMSSLMMALAVNAIQKGNLKSMRFSLLATIVCGSIFLSCQVFEFNNFVFEKHMTITNSILGTTFFTLTGTHGTHVAIGVLWLILMYVRSFKAADQSTSLARNFAHAGTVILCVLLTMYAVLTLIFSLQAGHSLGTWLMARGTFGPLAVELPLHALGLAALVVVGIAFSRFAKVRGPVQFDQSNAVDVESMGLYWHFVDIVWIVIFTAVYLLEYL